MACPENFHGRLPDLDTGSLLYDKRVRIREGLPLGALTVLELKEET